MEAQALILHGLGDDPDLHQTYISDFRKMTEQVERVYDAWVLDNRRKPAAELVIPEK